MLSGPMRVACSLALLLLLGAACRVVTAVEVETRVEADGSGARTLRVHSRWADGRDEEAALPPDLLRPAAGYAVAEPAPGVLEASASFARLDAAPAPFAFGGGARRTAFPARFRAEDWVLFRIVHYEESVADLADPDDLRAALEECVAVGLGAADAACARVFGADFEDTILRERLRGDLREVARDVVFTIWQELYAGEPDLERLLARALPRLEPAGLELRAEWFGEDEEGFGLPRARAAIAAWVEAQLRPRREGARTPQPVGLESVLFDGAFAAELTAALERRFGGAQGLAAWWEGMEPRLKGSFGAGRDDVTFTLRVKMPGALLRSDGWLEASGSSFVQFPAHEAYPRGRGIACASVVWDDLALAALPTAGLLPDNAAALAWTRVLGDGPDSAPSAELAGLLRVCVAERSLAALEDAAADPEREALAAAAARALAWLQGARG